MYKVCNKWFVCYIHMICPTVFALVLLCKKKEEKRLLNKNLNQINLLFPIDLGEDVKNNEILVWKSIQFGLDVKCAKKLTLIKTSCNGFCFVFIFVFAFICVCLKLFSFKLYMYPLGKCISMSSVIKVRKIKVTLIASWSSLWRQRSWGDIFR